MVSTGTVQSIPRAHLRWGIWLLLPAGLIPALIFTLWMSGPDPSSDLRRSAEMMAGPLGLGTTFAYIVALIALLLGLQALYGWLAGGPMAGWALAGLVLGVASVALLVAGFSTGGLGAAVVADLYLSGKTGVGDAFASLSGGSFGWPILMAFTAAIVLAIPAAIAYGVAIWRTASLPRWSAVLFSLGFILVAASFPIATQLGGVLLAVAGVWMARALGQGDGVVHTESPEYQGMAHSS